MAELGVALEASGRQQDAAVGANPDQVAVAVGLGAHHPAVLHDERLQRGGPVQDGVGLGQGHQ